MWISEKPSAMSSVLALVRAVSGGGDSSADRSVRSASSCTATRIDRPTGIHLENSPRLLANARERLVSGGNAFVNHP